MAGITDHVADAGWRFADEPRDPDPLGRIGGETGAAAVAAHWNGIESGGWRMSGALESMGMFDDGGIDEDEAEFGGVPENVEVESAEEDVAGALEFVGDRHTRGEDGFVHGGIEFDQGVWECVEDRETDCLLPDEVGTSILASETIPRGVTPVDAQVSVEEVDDGGVVLQRGPGEGSGIGNGAGDLHSVPCSPE